MALLATHAMSVAFGGLRAVRDAEIAVPEGALVGLIGPNGAGKTSFIDGITGFVRTTGTILFEGREIGGLPPHKRARLGLGRTWQSLELFDDLTIEENLQVAADRPSVSGFLLDVVAPCRHRSTEAVDFALDVLGIRDLAQRMPSEISQGQRELVSVDRALAAKPKLVCMDEPAAGLDSQESAQLGRHLRDITDTGVSILLVDHDMGLVLDICDYVYVIEFGEKLAEGTPAEIKTNQLVVDAYLGKGSRSDEAVDGRLGDRERPT